MIINPARHTIISSVNSHRRFQGRVRIPGRGLPGGKQLWLTGAKLLLFVLFFLVLISIWLAYSVGQVNAKIEQIGQHHHQLVNANILLRAQKAKLFSPEMVGELAADHLAIYLPGNGQYKKY